MWNVLAAIGKRLTGDLQMSAHSAATTSGHQVETNACTQYDKLSFGSGNRNAGMENCLLT